MHSGTKVCCREAIGLGAVKGFCKKPNAMSKMSDKCVVFDCNDTKSKEYGERGCH